MNRRHVLKTTLPSPLALALMLAGQTLGATVGLSTNADVITAFSMDLNGNGITVSNAAWEEMKKHIPMGPDGKPVLWR